MEDIFYYGMNVDQRNVIGRQQQNAAERQQNIDPDNLQEREDNPPIQNAVPQGAPVDAPADAPVIAPNTLEYMNTFHGALDPVLRDTIVFWSPEYNKQMPDKVKTLVSKLRIGGGLSGTKLEFTRALENLFGSIQIASQNTGNDAMSQLMQFTLREYITANAITYGNFDTLASHTTKVAGVDDGINTNYALIALQAFSGDMERFSEYFNENFICWLREECHSRNISCNGVRLPIGEPNKLKHHERCDLMRLLAYRANNHFYCGFIGDKKEGPRIMYSAIKNRNNYIYQSKLSLNMLDRIFAS